MRRLIPVGLLCTGFLAGLAVNPRTGVTAQEGRGRSAQAQPPDPMVKFGEGVVFTKEYIEKTYPVADKAGNFPSSNVSINMIGAPEYRITQVRRLYYDPPRKSQITGEMIRYPDAEMHENMTQIYFFWRGTGTQVLGGAPEKLPPPRDDIGDYRGGSTLVGGKSYRVKPGDVVVIPPHTWHQTQPDPGQTLGYHMVHIVTRTRMP